LQAPPGTDKMRSDFLFILVLGHLLPAGLVQRLIEQRIAWYRDCIRNMETSANDDRPASVKFVNDLGLAIYRAAVEFLEEHRHDLVEETPPQRASVAE